MDKNNVIAFRDSLLLDGKNNSIRILFDNGINVLLSSDCVLWDDTNERIVAFVSDNKSGSFSANKPVEIICSTYENIQFITAGSSLKDLEKFIDSLGKSVVKISEENKKAILDYFENCHKNVINLADTEYYCHANMRENVVVKK